MDQRREHLLDAALAVLARDGYGQVTVDAIAREAGVTRPVVYAAFDGLEPLLHALLDRTQKRAFESALTLLPQDGAPHDIDAWLLEATAGLIDLVRTEPEVWRPILGLTRNPPTVVRERIEATEQLIRSFIADALRSGLDQRGGPDLDIEVTAHLVLVTAEHFGRLVLEEPERYSKERLVAALGMLLSAASPPPRRASRRKASRA